jgi:hypothetical protein
VELAASQAVLVDTDVFSYLMNPRDQRGRLYTPHVEGKLLAVSFVTVGELLFGAYRRNGGQPRLDQTSARSFHARPNNAAFILAPGNAVRMDVQKLGSVVPGAERQIALLLEYPRPSSPPPSPAKSPSPARPLPPPEPHPPCPPRRHRRASTFSPRRAAGCCTL